MDDLRAKIHEAIEQCFPVDDPSHHWLPGPINDAADAVMAVLAAYSIREKADGIDIAFEQFGSIEPGYPDTGFRFDKA